MSTENSAGNNPGEGTRPASDDLRGHASVLANLDPGFTDATEGDEPPARRSKAPDVLTGRPDIGSEARERRAPPAERDDEPTELEDYSALFGDDPPEDRQQLSRSDPEAFELDLPDGSKLSSKELKELRSDGLRLADYTRKTKELAEHRKHLEGRVAGLEQQEQSLTQRFQQVLFILRSKLPPEPVGELAFTQPHVYNQQRAVYDHAVREIQQVNDVWFEHQKAREHALSLANQDYARSEAEKLKEFFPQLNDRERADRFVKEIAKGVAYYGFDENDVNATMDSRIWRMAAHAIMWQRLVEKNSRPKRDASGQFVAKDNGRAQTVRPQARQAASVTRSQNYKRDREALARTGSLQDAARVIAALDRDN